MTCFRPQETSNTAVAYIREVDCALPGSPVLKAIRKTSYAVDPAIETVRSDEITNSRQAAQIIPVGGSLAGPQGIEWMFKEYDELVAGALQFDWVDIDEAVTDLSIPDATHIDRATGSFIADGFVVGAHVRLAGATNSSNNQIMRITGVTALQLTVAPITPLVAEGTFSGNVDASYCWNDSVNISFFFEEWLKKVNEFFQHKNVEVNGFSWTFDAKAKINATVDLLGVEAVKTGTTASTASYLPAEVFDIMNTTSHLKNIRIAGAALGSTFATNLTLAVSNQMEARPAIGEFWGLSPRSGEFIVTGSLDLYLAGTSLNEWDNLRNNVARSLDFRTVDKDGNTYVFEVPRFKWVGMPVVIPGKNQDMKLVGAFESEEDPITGRSFILNRFAA